MATSQATSLTYEAKVPLLESAQVDHHHHHDGLAQRVWVESKKLWHITGPAIFSRVVSYAILVITQAFAGHLGDLELAAISIVINVIIGFDIGLLVCLYINLYSKKIMIFILKS